MSPRSIAPDSILDLPCRPITDHDVDDDVDDVDDDYVDNRRLCEFTTQFIPI